MNHEEFAVSKLSSVKERSPIMDALCELEKAVSANGEALNRLALRIKPVLGDGYPREEKDKLVEVSPSSDVAMMLVKLTGMLNSTTMEAHYVADRVEL